MTAPTAMKEFLSVNRLAFAAISTSEKDALYLLFPLSTPARLAKGTVCNRLLLQCKARSLIAKRLPETYRDQRRLPCSPNIPTLPSITF